MLGEGRRRGGATCPQDWIGRDDKRSPPRLVRRPGQGEFSRGQRRELTGSKMYSDLMEEDAPVITTRQEQRGSSLASRMGRR